MGAISGLFAGRTIGWFVALIVVWMVVKTILGRGRNSRMRQERAAAFEPMRFHEETRQQVFGTDSRWIGKILVLMPISPSPWVGVGESLCGPTVIFEIQKFVQNRFSLTSTVVGFRVSPEVPDFDICRRHVLDSAAEAPPAPSAFPKGAAGESVVKLGPLKAKFHPAARQLHEVSLAPEDEFTKSYRMYSSDPGSAPRMLTQAFRDHLAPLDYGDLDIRGANGWIFVLRINSRVAPAQYPEVLDAAVMLVSKLDLPATAATH